LVAGLGLDLNARSVTLARPADVNHFSPLITQKTYSSGSMSSRQILDPVTSSFSKAGSVEKSHVAL
jgi:hypothetical protein